MHLAPMRCMDQVGDDAEVTSDDEVLQLPLVVGRDIVTSEDEELQLPIAGEEDITSEDEEPQLPINVDAGVAFGTMQLVVHGPRTEPGAHQSLGQCVLRAKPLTQFVLPVGVWRPDLDQPGVLDLWSGCRRFSNYCVQHGAPWALTYDLNDDATRQDLLESPLP